jgi:hypothetical protein
MKEDLEFALRQENEALRAQAESLRRWVSDLQSGMYINCVYCGHRYGPADSVQPSMQEILHQHVRVCPKHPLARALEDMDTIRRMVAEVNGDDPETWPKHGNAPLAIASWLALLKIERDRAETGA